MISFGDMIKLILSTIGKKRIVANVPMTLAKIQSSLLGLLPIDPIITKDQCLILSEKDNVVSGDHLTLKDLNIGNLTANEDYNFISTKSTDFHFKYNSNGIKKEKITIF